MPSAAQWGNEILVNTTVTGDQDGSSIAALADGRFVVAWTDTSQTGDDTSFNAVRAQIFNADGTKSGSEFVVETATESDQQNAAVAALSDGRFIVTWDDYSGSGGDTGMAIRAQVFNIDGTRSGSESLVNSTTNGGQFSPHVAGLGDGGYVITWNDFGANAPDTSYSGVRGRAFSASGAESLAEFPVNTSTSGYQYLQKVAALDDGGFVVVWRDDGANAPDTDGSVRAQRYGADGTAAGAEFVVATTTSGSQQDPAIAALAGGNFVVAWTDDSQTGGDTSSFAVRARVFAHDGTEAVGEFLVNATTPGSQRAPDVVALPDGRFAIAWQDESSGDVDVRLQVFSGNGIASGGEIVVNTTSSGDQSWAHVAALADGRLVVTWEDDSQTGGDTSGHAVRAQILDLRDAPVTLAGTAHSDDFVGTAFADFLAGGNAGSDRLDGGAGADQMAGGIGNDVYVVDNPGDIVSELGGQGTDTILASVSRGLGANVEKLTLTGSAAINGFGNTLANVLVGNGAANLLAGGAGNDRLLGEAGNDILKGGLGADRLDGGYGYDVLIGGKGKDAFIFDTELTHAGIDRIAGYAHGIDKIDLSHAIFAALSAAGKPLAAGMFFAGHAAHDANDHIVYNPANGFLFYDSNGNHAGGVNVHFATLAAHLTLSAADFLVAA